ncbi:MAG: hypothetical protein P4M11_03940 [Candidatus Pacebacteria bacterium]|nr:hypothetical protein [Candidatus Paceibacterota bacterium]
MHNTCVNPNDTALAVRGLFPKSPISPKYVSSYCDRKLFATFSSDSTASGNLVNSSTLPLTMKYILLLGSSSYPG